MAAMEKILKENGLPDDFKYLAVAESDLRITLIAHSAGSVKPIVTEALYDRGVKVTTAAAAATVLPRLGHTAD